MHRKYKICLEGRSKVRKRNSISYIKFELVQFTMLGNVNGKFIHFPNFLAIYVSIQCVKQKIKEVYMK